MAKKESKERGLIKPAKPVSQLEDIERRFEEFFRRPFSLIGPSWFPRLSSHEMEELSPTVDIFEDGSDVVVKAELPGMKKDDIDVKLTDNTITISGEKKKEEKVEKKNFYRMERSYGAFTRSFSLPADVQADKAKALFNDGILEIRVPKTEEAKQKERKITIE